MNSVEEGVVKYQSDWTKSPAESLPDEAAFFEARAALFEAGLIGSDSSGIGYGNLSVRLDGLRFIVTGTQTSGIAQLTIEHLSTVESFQIEQNRLTCRGPVRASSEALSHAALYQAHDSIGAVAHIHNALMWEQLPSRYPSTPRDAEYGTPAIAKALAACATHPSGIIIMGGHPEGIIAYGPDISSCCSLLLRELC